MAPLIGSTANAVTFDFRRKAEAWRAIGIAGTSDSRMLSAALYAARVASSVGAVLAAARCVSNTELDHPDRKKSTFECQRSLYQFSG